MNSHQLVIEKTLKAPQVKVFNAWTNPDLICQWMGPGEVKCKNAEVNLTEGGEYKIHMHSEEGDHIATGKYIQIEPHHTLKFTWGWIGGEVQNTQVTVTIEDLGNQSKIKILHEKFSTDEAAQKHTYGWNGCLENLIKFLNV